MKYIECPQIYTPASGEKSIFFAGGITNCGDWQSDLVNLLSDTDLSLINPRRKNFDLNNSNIEEEQIKWEFEHLNKTLATSFWFPQETLCPITLYELGKKSEGVKPLFIGIHPEYKRKRDVEIQTKLARPDVMIVHSLEDLAMQIKLYL